MMNDVGALRFESADRSLQVVIDPKCVAHWWKYRQTRIWHREAGGLLFAPTIGTDDGRIEICTVSGPFSTDRRRRYSVEFDHARCIDEIQTQFHDGRHFVGYWHTHPEKSPSISGIDRRAFIRNLRSEGIEIDRILALVIGTMPIESSVSAYVINSHGAIKLSKVEIGQKRTNQNTL